MADTALPKNGRVVQGDFRKRFADQIEPDLNSGCHLWAGSASPKGYGTISWEGGSRLAHRCAYEDANGIGSADGVVVRHKCDTPPCVNEQHLLGGTSKDNSDDAWARGRMRPAKGEDASKAIVSEHDVLKMRAMARNGFPMNEIARAFPQVKRNAVDAAVRGKSWAHLPGAVQTLVKAKPPGGKPGQGASVITESIASDIKRRARAGERTKDIAATHGVTAVLVSAIKHGRIWKHAA